MTMPSSSFRFNLQFAAASALTAAQANLGLSRSPIVREVVVVVVDTNNQYHSPSAGSVAVGTYPLRKSGTSSTCNALSTEIGSTVRTNYQCHRT